MSATSDSPVTKLDRVHQKVSYLPDIHRLLPQSVEAERGLLGSYLLAPKEVREMCLEYGVTPDYFHLPSHQLIFAALEDMHREGKPVDFVTLTQHLRDLTLLEECGGPGFVSELFTFLPTAANAGHYRAIVEEKYILRRIIRVCTEYAARCYDEQNLVSELLDGAQRDILKIGAAEGAQDTIVPIAAVVDEALAAIEETFRSRGGILGVPSGFHAFDRMTRGVRKAELWIIAARPSMGKSAMLLNMAEHVAYGPGKGTGRPVLVFSLEMPARSLCERMLAARANVRLEAITRDGYLTKEAFYNTVPQAAEKMKGGPIYFDDTPGLSIQQMRARARRFARQHRDCAAIYVDYLQLVASDTKRAKDFRQLEVDEVATGLKQLARELSIPVIAAAQLNRENDGPNSPPKLSNLRESGTIEQHADGVLAIHRKHYYTKAPEDAGKATICLLKQRNGPTGDFELEFDAEHTRFSSPHGEALYSNNLEERQK